MHDRATKDALRVAFRVYELRVALMIGLVVAMLPLAVAVTLSLSQ